MDYEYNNVFILLFHTVKHVESPIVVHSSEPKHVNGRPQPGTVAKIARCSAAAALLACATPVPGGEHDGASPLTLTLGEVVQLALRNNRTLLSARHGREVQRLSLSVREDRYRPRASIGASVRDNDTGPGTASLSAGPSIRIPIGGEFRLDWSRPIGDRNDRAGAWTLRFSQPLLQGFGIDVDTAPVHLARIGERKNVLAFRDAIAGVIGSVVTAYRSVIRAHRAIAISRESLARSERQLAINRSLIRAGRMAVREIIQTEAEIANRELALVRSENGLSTANAALISILDVDGATTILPVRGMPSIELVRLDPDSSIETALANRSDFHVALLDQEVARINLRLAQDARRWNLTLDASVARGVSGERDYAVGLGLAIPLGDRSPALDEASARNELRNAGIALAELRQSIPIEVRQALHDVEVGFRLVELARKARGLAEQQVEVEQRKIAQGLTSTFQLTAVEDDLVGAQTNELDAGISYLNALTALDRALGTTLQTWGIDAAEFESGKPQADLGAESVAASDFARTRAHRRPDAATPGDRSLWLRISGRRGLDVARIE